MFVVVENKITLEHEVECLSRHLLAPVVTENSCSGAFFFGKICLQIEGNIIK